MSKEIWNSEKAVVVEVFMVFFLQKKNNHLQFTIFKNIILILTFTHDTGELSRNVAV